MEIVVGSGFVTQNGDSALKSHVAVVNGTAGLTIAAMAEPLIVTVAGHTPQLDPQSWVAPNASLIGRVRLAARVGVWYSATLRAEAELIDIGAGTNIQDGVTVHVDPGFPVRVGAGVSVGHNAVLHGCTIGDGVLIGMGAIVLNAAVVGEGSLVAVGALITQGMTVPPRSLVAGVPGKVRRELSDSEVAANRHNSAVYEHLIDVHRDARQA